MKRILSLLLLAVLTASLLALPAQAAAPANRFHDLGDNSAAMSVESLRLLGVMDGFADGSFRPNAQLTRAQFCKMVVCALNAEDELGLYRTVTIYPDVKPSHWAAAYINMAAKGKNAISGYSDGKFYPDRTVTLGQAATILLRVLGYKDENVGGVWPDSYLSFAASIGLTDGVDTANGSLPLNRSDAATLFNNLLQADVQGEKGSSAFLSSAGLTTVPDMVLVSSNAKGPDGEETAMLFANGEVYQMAGDKVSNGTLNGYKGTLVLEGSRVRTFIPDARGVSRSVVASKIEEFQITERSGSKYSVATATKVYYQGKETTWGEVRAWLNPGASLTLYLGSAGNVEYIFVGGGGTASEAIVVYEKGSTKGFESLAGNMGGYKIYKHGSKANAKDMRPYDVATYSSSTNTIRVCDTRLTGYYESCTPSPTEPTSIRVLGNDFPVLTSARATLAKFRPTSVKVQLLCGITIEGTVDLGAMGNEKLEEIRTEELQNIANRMVRVSSTGKNTIGLVRLGGGVSGALDLEKRKLGSSNLAETVSVYRYTSKGLETLSLNDLGAGPISAGEISYAHVNWAGQVDVIVLGGVNNGGVFYGRVSITVGSREDSYRISVVSPDGTKGPYYSNYDITHGTYVAAVESTTGLGFSSLKPLTVMKDVPNTAWSGRSAVTIDGRSYSVPSNVMCYNKDISSWVTLEEAHAYTGKCDMYASDDGVIRAIEIDTRFHD